MPGNVTGSLLRSLIVRILLAVLLFVLPLGGFLYLTLQAGIGQYVRASVHEDMMRLADDVYLHCDNGLEELLRGGKGDNPVMGRIQRAKTAGRIDDFMRQRWLRWVVSVDGATYQRSRDLPPGVEEGWEGLPEGEVVPARIDGRRVFLYRFGFDPWNWRIVLVKEQAAYDALLSRLDRTYAVLALLLAVGALLLLWLLHRLIRRPVAEIIAALKEDRSPAYEGIHEFEFLSGHIAGMMDNLKQKGREAEAASRAKSQFLANMSHELRTPMNAVLGYAQLLEVDPELGEEQRQDVEEILTAGRHLLHLINEVLDLAKVEAGQLTLEWIELDLAGLVEEIGGTYAPQARAKGLELLVDLEPALPRWVAGDPTRLRQILANLVGNALKFTERGAVRLTAGPAPAGEGVVLTVEDSGIGIPAEVCERLFQPFMQADETTTRRFGGTGLGLALTHDLVEAMGGEIGVESEPGRGSRFRVRLPLPLAEGADEAAGRVPEGGGEAVPAAATGFHGRVLVVEDNPVNLQLTVGMLAGFGLVPDTATDGEQALARLAERRYDLVLMDVQMPVLDGLETVRRLREGEAREGLPRTPVVALTANVMAGDRERALAAGMDGYQTKPVQLPQLMEQLARWLPGTGAEGADVAAVAAVAVAGSLDPAALANLRAGLATVPGGLEEILRAYLEEAPKLLEEIAAGLAAADAERVTRAAHSLKSQSAAVGAMVLSERCRELEMHGRSGGLAGADELLREAEAAWGAVRPALADLVGDG